MFLPNDVIFIAGMPANTLYFIVSGTVAIYTTKGRELFHIHDGEHFGEMELILTYIKQETLCSCVAVDITECLRINKEDLWHLIYLYIYFILAGF